MQKLVLERSGRQLAVWMERGSQAAVSLLYSPGLGSVAQGEKSEAVRRFAHATGASFIRYDLFGHGESSGEQRQLLVSSAVKDLESVAHLALKDAPSSRLVFFGASFGGLVSALLAAKSTSLHVHGVVLIGGAIDFCSRVQAYRRNADGDIIIDSAYCGEMVLNKSLLEDVQNLDKEWSMEQIASALKAKGVHVVAAHGLKDDVVPAQVVRSFIDVVGPNGTFLEFPEGDHRLNGPIEEIIQVVQTKILDIQSD